MQEHKKYLKWMIIIFSITFVFCIISEYNFLDNFIEYIRNRVAFFVGHRQFYTNILMGIMGSSFLVALTSIVGYSVDKERLENHLSKNFLLLNLRTTQMLRDNLEFSDCIRIIKEIEEIQHNVVSFRYEYFPINNKAKRNKKVFEKHLLICNVHNELTLSLNHLKKISIIENEIKKIEDEIYRKKITVQNCTAKESIMIKCVSQIEERREKIINIQNEFLQDVKNRIRNLTPQINEIKDYFKLEV